MKNKQVNVAMIQRIFPHYRAPIFDLLDKKFTFVLIHSRNKDNIPQIVRSYSCLKPMVNIRGIVYIFGQFHLYKCSPDAVFQEFSLSVVNLYLTYLYCKLTKCKLILWGHGYKRKQGFDPKNKLSDKIRAFFIRNSDAILLYSDETKTEMESWFQDAVFFVARNSIQSTEKEEQYKGMTTNGKQFYKNKHKCNYDFNLVFIARITGNRKVELLPELVERIKSITNKSFLIHLIGDGDSKNKLERMIQKNNLKEYFRIYGAVYDEHLASEVIYLSEFLVIPASLGLSVNHAFCYGTPVATLKNERHGPEASFIQDNHNGILCSDIQNMANRIVNVIENEKAMNNMSCEARDYFCKNLGIESMYKGFSDAIRHVL